MVEYTVEIDLVTFEECNSFFVEITSLLEDNNEVKINFKKVKFISSTAAGRILSIQKKIQGTDKKVYIINLRKEIKNILDELSVIELTENIVYQ